MKISEMITDKYKLRIPPTVYYELLADVQEAEDEQEPTNKNNIPHCQCTDEEIAKSFIEDVEAVKELLPTTKNNLGVDWDELKRKILMEVDGGIDDNWLRYADVCDRISNSIDEYIADLSSVTPQEPKTGRWISTETKGVRYAFWCRYKCSLCGGLSARTNFCPNCGARMVEPQESEDKE